jgi:hypothetical protein
MPTIPNNLDAKKVEELKNLLKLKGLSLKGKNAELMHICKYIQACQSLLLGNAAR